MSHVGVKYVRDHLLTLPYTHVNWRSYESVRHLLPTLADDCVDSYTCQLPLIYFTGNGVVLFGASEVTVRLISVGIASASRGILSYILKKYKFYAYYFLLLTIFVAIYGGASEIVRAWVQEKEYQLEIILSGVCGQME
jgi:hypothetical protein